MLAISMCLALLPFVSAALIDINVGAEGQLRYSPEAIAAVPGDQVVFHFHPKNHTVTQSSFADPCGKINKGIDSGFQPVPANQTDNLPTFTITVTDKQPIWVYCAQAAGTPESHCGQGMVFAINCGQDGAPNSFTNFKKAALAVGASLSAAAATATPTATVTTAAYGSYTIPPTPVATTTTYSSYPNSPDPTPVSVNGQIHKVVVGGPGVFAFDPPFVQANPQDTVVFEFHQKNHTATQSSFSDPCSKLNQNGSVGFDSGFIAVPDNATVFPTYNFTVTDTKPVWAYCRQLNHCELGMVFAINSDETSARNFQAFQNLAKARNGTTANAVNPSTTQTSGTTSGAIGRVSVLLLVTTLIGSLL